MEVLTMDNSIYVLIVTDDEEKFRYEYGNITHAREHYNREVNCQLYELNDDKYYMMDCKAV
jgi:hypothetical protein